MNSWILVADSAHARIFNAETAKSALSEVESMIHPEAQQHERELTSDLPGRQAGGAADSHHSVGGKTDAKEHEANHTGFYRRVNGFLQTVYRIAVLSGHGGDFRYPVNTGLYKDWINQTVRRQSGLTHHPAHHLIFS